MKVILVGFWNEQVDELCKRFPNVEFRTTTKNMDGYQADAVISGDRAAFDEIFKSGFLRRCETLRWVHASGAGIETYCGPELTSMPFTLTNEQIIQGPEVADHGMALLLSLTRRIGHVLKGIPRDRMPRPVELQGKHALIIGSGGVGLAIAERAAAFGMRVSVLTESNFPYLSFISERYLAGQLLEALPPADVVFVAAPLTPITRKMIERSALAVMKSSAYLINVTRGAIIDTDELVQSLLRGHLSGVGLDVTDPEPLPSDHPLRTCERVILTPHMAGMSDRLSERCFDLVATNLRRFVDCRPLINVVNKELGF